MKAMTKFSGMSPLEAIQRDMDLIFDDLSPFSRIRRGNGGHGMQLWAPDTDMSETEEAYLLTVDLPGLTKKDIEVSYGDNRVTISGERKEENEDKGRNWHKREYSYGSFYRVVDLPARVDGSKAKARFKKGMLKVTLPKLGEKENNRKKIDITGE